MKPAYNTSAEKSEEKAIKFSSLVGWLFSLPDTRGNKTSAKAACQPLAVAGNLAGIQPLPNNLLQDSDLSGFL
ncbi:MAG: hypothetical protein ABSB30_14600 [Terracidiphilus sp.]|jgi:hypothetical protein